VAKSKAEAAISIRAAAAKLGKKGGIKGGPARARALSEGQRSAIARMGAKARNAKR
jgi:hypothetical protein